MRWPAPCASTASAACAIVAPKPSSIAPAGSRWSPRPSCCGTPSISAAPWTRYVGTVSQCRKQSLPISRPWAGATSISPAITSGPATANLTPTVSGLSGAALQPWPPWQPPDVPALSAWSESVPVLSGDPNKASLLDLEVSDEELAKAFAELAARFRKNGHGTSASQPPARPAAHTPANGAG